MLQTMHELRETSLEAGLSLGATALLWQAKTDGVEPSVLLNGMNKRLKVMKDSVKHGLAPDLRSVSGQVGGQSSKLLAQKERFGVFSTALTYALAIAESNACMGKIVAAPTAGSCGILPAAMLSVQEVLQKTDKEICYALFCAAAVGRVITLQATVSGAEGGCQAECGAAAAMAAAALVELYGGSPCEAIDAVGFTLMNMLGLVCDPVGGLVEIPCVYRNVGGVSQAFAGAQLALCGVPCPIPCDEIVLAMKEVGDAMPSSLRETGEGGCAGCPSMR